MKGYIFTVRKATRTLPPSQDQVENLKYPSYPWFLWCTISNNMRSPVSSSQLFIFRMLLAKCSEGHFWGHNVFARSLEHLPGCWFCSRSSYNRWYGFMFREHLSNASFVCLADQMRFFVGMSQEKYVPSGYEKLCLSLLSSLPNEVDYALNIITLMSGEGSTLQLSKAPKLIDLLLAHTGIYSAGTMFLPLLLSS